jgi:hypothetical protein
MSLSPEKAQIELAWAGAPVGTPDPEFGTPGVPGGPITSPAKAAFAPSPATAAAHSTVASDLLSILSSPVEVEASRQTLPQDRATPE